MNLPNKLTVLRVCIVPLFVILAMLEGWGWQLTATLVFLIASFTDMLDGKIAREQNLVTNFGKFADPIADKLLVMAAMVVLVGQNRMPAWVCILMLAREFIISGLRCVAADNGRVIAAGKLGKIKTVSQMVAITMILLLVPISGAPLLGHFGVVISNIVMYFSLVMALISGAEYVVNNIDCIRDL